MQDPTSEARPQSFIRTAFHPGASKLREGSTWRKWDLHLHAPTSALNNQFEGASLEEKWEKYLETLESLEGFACLGVTDYFSIDGYKRLRDYKKQSRLQNVPLLLPNVELRVLPVTDKKRAINVHLILNPTIADELDELLFSRLEFRYQGAAYSCTRNGLIRFGRAVSDDDAMTEDTAYRTGVGQFKIELSNLKACLERDRRLRNNALVVVANGSNDGNSGIQDSGLRAVRQELYALADCIFSANPKDSAYFLGLGADSRDEIVRKYGGLKPCIHGCDAHDLSQVGNPDGERHTWIKAEATFEGLRQICHEPAGRVKVGAHSPEVPVHRIRAAKLAFPSGSLIRWKDSDEVFCFRGETELAFAAGLTCVIGGRGAGKSTLLNIIHERLAPGKNEFFEERKVRCEGSVLNLQECVDMVFAGDQAGLEFISQNQVERLALNPESLTKAILSRLLGQDNGPLKAALEEIKATLSDTDRCSELVRKEAGLIDDLRQIASDLNTTSSLLESFSDPVYQEATSALQSASTQLASLRTDRTALSAVVDATERAIGRANAGGPSVYQKVLNQFVLAVRRAIDEVRQQFDLEKPNSEEIALEGRRDECKQTVEEFLKERGLSTENLSDVAGASERISELQAEEDKKSVQLDQARAELKELEIREDVRSEFEGRVNAALSELNDMLGRLHAEARRIQLCYEFDTKAAEDALIEELGAAVGEIGGRRLSSNNVRGVLEKAGPIFDVGIEQLIESVRTQPGRSAEALDAYLGVEANQRLWELSRLRARLNVERFMRLSILYDGRTLELSSFGQRCSAVLIILLMLGNTPIMIDEPEAHLDSALIANYLVHLIQEVKKRRQVIFATHNANIVVNGDAELVHVVSMDEANRSTIASITIEDVEARDLLLALEGGEAAFAQREGRYRLHA